MRQTKLVSSLVNVWAHNNIVFDLICFDLKSNNFLHKSPSNRWLRNGIHSLLSQADARESADIIYRM